MVKPHSIFDGAYIATVVVVPIESTKTKKDGTEVDCITFIPLGVRIEDTSTRTTVGGTYVIPGYSYFFRFSTHKLSEASPYTPRAHRCGPYLLGPGGSPEMLKPKHKVKGVPLSDHPLHRRFETLIAQARARYNEWRRQVQPKIARGEGPLVAGRFHLDDGQQLRPRLLEPPE
jgi:hypothetical protein